MLTVTDVSVSYGPISALQNVSLHLESGHIGTVLGSNGAGKSTLLKVISGLVAPSTGTVEIEGHGAVTHVPTHKRVRFGIGHVLEGHRVFGNESVHANLLLGGLDRYKSRASRAEVLADVEAQYERFPILGQRRRQAAATLSGGEQQMLATAVALMSRPSLLLLDEPSLGLAPKLVDETFQLIASLRGEGLTILLVEQLATLALQVADEAWVLQRGSVIAAGPANRLSKEMSIWEAYLGGTPTSGSSRGHDGTDGRQDIIF